ncbi:MAG: TetR/AcrR family transcriptional regulator [Actinobacteria bacterium]|nr:TetR/AcrR family transcriptional regulator [Actinomycetota bacterium]
MSAGKLERPRAAHLGPDRRRPAVLDAALAIATEDGARGVSMGAVAQRIGVTRPVVYACYTNRAELMTALLEREEQYLLAGVLAALPSGAPRNGGTQAVFVRGFQALLAVVAERPESWRFVFDPAPGADVAERFARSRAVVAEQFARLIRPSLEHWGTTDVERKLPVLVELFMSSGEGAVRALLHEGSSWTTEELGGFVGQAVYRAVRGA